MNYLILSLTSIILFISSCSLKPVLRTKNIVYNSSKGLKLDIYSPKKIKESKKVLVFVYGGNWTSGRRSLYRFFGKGVARKGLVCVVLDYRLSPNAEIAGMASDVADAIKWVKENSLSFKGDSMQIYIAGHSAGGHLAAMVATDNSYFEKIKIKNPIKGVILIDAFGLDMNHYLGQSNNPKDSIYKPVFSNNPANWKKYSPINYLNKNTVPFMLLLGDKTYAAIADLNNIFYDKIKKYQPQAPLIIYNNKKHIPMIGQFYNSRTKAYKDILNFMDANK
jgi:acetyl esterase/lipase